ncbi:MAG: adenylyltransferase/cytidyltransferase family protein [Fusobacterium sp.]|nr:adenylyltransferase/cytidyltransferase family protein [Fusobacterium sp.]
MTKVITYGTYDLLHYGHIRLLERAKALGDYLIVGVTADDFDKIRGKINVQQSLMERIEGIRETGLADEIIIEEYEGQKIDDIRKYDISIFAIGSDWKGKFDYLEEYCKVVYLKRTEGVSSSELRSQKRKIRLGIVGNSPIAKKFSYESSFVNGIEITAIMSSKLDNNMEKNIIFVNNYNELLKYVDAIYLVSNPQQYYDQIKSALIQGKHVLCESPVALSKEQYRELFKLANEKKCILMDALKTAYATAYNRLILLAKEGKIGDIYSVDATCTSLRNKESETWDSICYWGPTALLPVFNILGTEYLSKKIISHLDNNCDLFTKIDFIYSHAVASIKVGKGVKSEGDLIISGTKGYIYVPAPWWKTDYFEIRFENATNNRRYFYHLDGEGIRYELVAFIKAIESSKNLSCINIEVSEAICDIINDFYSRIDFEEI